MEIKLMTIGDCNRVYSLWARTPGMKIYTKDDSPEGIERFLRRNPTTSFLAMDGTKTIGTVLGGHDGRRGYIYNVCVDATYRAEGIGRAMLDRTLGAMQAENISRVFITTAVENLVGNAFWNAIGWELRGDLNCYDYILDKDNTMITIKNR